MAKALKPIDANAAARLREAGALMVDVREAGEVARAGIPGAANVALSRLEIAELPAAPGQKVVFFCASGNRTNVNAARLVAKAGNADAYVMQGGISAWSAAGLPVESGGSANEGGAGRGFFSRLLG